MKKKLNKLPLLSTTNCSGQCAATNSATTSEKQGIYSNEIKTEMKAKKTDNT
jgi:hypothetical protein